LIFFVILRQKYLQTRRLISDAISAINLNVHSSVDGSPPNDVLEVELAGRVLKLRLADPLVNLSDLKPLRPHFIAEFVKSGLALDLIVWVCWLLRHWRYCL